MRKGCLMGGRFMSPRREGELESYSEELNIVLTMVARIHLRLRLRLHLRRLRLPHSHLQLR